MMIVCYIDHLPAKTCIEIVKGVPGLEPGHLPLCGTHARIFQMLRGQANEDAKLARAVGYPIDEMEIREHELHHETK